MERDYGKILRCKLFIAKDSPFYVIVSVLPRKVFWGNGYQSSTILEDFALKNSKILFTVLGQNIRAIRQARRYTQKQLAHLSGISVAQISRLERGTGGTTPETLFALRAALQCSITELLKDAE